MPSFLKVKDVADVERTEYLKKVFQTEVTPTANQKVLYFLFDHLNRVNKLAAANKMTAYNLAVVWSPTLFQTGAEMLDVVEILILQCAQIMDG